MQRPAKETMVAMQLKTLIRLWAAYALLRLSDALARIVRKLVPDG